MRSLDAEGCGGTLAQADVYPKGMRATRDLLRRRRFRGRGSLFLLVAA